MSRKQFITFDMKTSEYKIFQRFFLNKYSQQQEKLYISVGLSKEEQWGQD